MPKSLVQLLTISELVSLHLSILNSIATSIFSNFRNCSVYSVVITHNHIYNHILKRNIFVKKCSLKKCRKRFNEKYNYFRKKTAELLLAFIYMVMYLSIIIDSRRDLLAKVFFQSYGIQAETSHNKSGITITNTALLVFE